ncbi:hypothetical protein I8J29_09135 [Paenibacillus sp. MWE-103]|uniref:Uncharacterized protein n=1 Tax=Paenibacillus artemisiicola TaxID=1172618 RepID=A0ABS3W855_9BACL|nr:hypothetical protein [Paenibacillus artemisiicola]MBO7744356.1 hypothetical protein [Paenibacillus artemisiicola]
MSTQFLDSRLSLNNTTSSGTTLLTTTPALFGDIGLQTVNAIGTPNENDVRIQLWGMVGVSRIEPNIVNIFVERGGTGVFGTGLLVFSSTIELTPGPGSRDLTFVTGDFPPVTDVVTGQIRYSMYLSINQPTAVILRGPVTFTGSASAGTS